MFGVFVFSERKGFEDWDQKIVLFPTEDAAVDWQLGLLVEVGEIRDAGGGVYEDPFTPSGCEEGWGTSDKREAIELWQDSCSSLEFFHRYPIFGIPDAPVEHTKYPKIKSPTEPGLYWFRFDDKQPWILTEAFIRDGGLMFQRRGFSACRASGLMGDNTEYRGPIPEPA